PELLDWLAVEFMDGGWSLKHLHRLIATSATYRQASRTSPDLLARDPYNRLLARGPRFRVDAEIVRDIALAASGLLDPEIRALRAAARAPRPSCSSRRPAPAPRSGGRHPARPGTAAPSTHSDTARSHIRCSSPSTRPMATPPASAALAPRRRARHSGHSTSR